MNGGVSGRNGVSGVASRCGWLLAVSLAATSGLWAHAQAPAVANKAFDDYVGGVEARILPPHAGREGMPPKLLPASGHEKMPRSGEVVIEKLTPGDGDVPGAMLHDWRGTAFAPGATAADFERVFGQVARYPEVYAPQVVGARVLGGRGDHRQMSMRVKQTHVITVVMDTDYDVTSGRTGPGAGWSASRSTAVREIADAGTGKEHALGPGDDHGFLWRLNSYWTYEETDGGLLLMLESVSLTRRVPAGLGWAVKPFVESVPRESLEFTLKKTVQALGTGGRRD